jgi:hypothetical protein
MARGTESKNTVFAKLQEVFPASFWEDEGKILRIPLDENGSRVEVKVSLTAAKNNLGGESIPSAFNNAPSSEKIASTPIPINKPVLEPTQEEKENVAKLIASLGL